MKKWFSVIGLILLTVLIGGGLVTLHGHGDRTYHIYVRRGQYDAIDHNYRDALNNFQEARKADPENKRVNRDLFQTQSYVSGNHYFYRHRWSLSVKNYRRSIQKRAVTAINHRASHRYRLVKALRDSSSQFSGWYDQALVLNHRHDFKASEARLNRIMVDPDLDLPYFKDFKAKVTKLLKADHKKDRSRQVSANVNNQTGAFKLHTPRIVTDHPSKVTINRARRLIRRAGVNGNEMSNGDVANVIRQAHQHHSSIQRYAKENY